MKVKPLSLVRLRVTPWTAAYQAPPSMGFSRQKYWSGVPSCYTMACSPPALCPWDFPGKNTGVVYHFLLQAIFPTQRLTLGLLHCRQILYQLSLTCQEGSVGSGCVLSCFSCVQLFATLWTVTCQAPLSKGFSSQEYWSGLPWPPPGDLSNLGIKPASRMPPAQSGRFFTTTAIWKPLISPTTAFWKQRICFYLHKSMDGE